MVKKKKTKFLNNNTADSPPAHHIAEMLDFMRARNIDLDTFKRMMILKSLELSGDVRLTVISAESGIDNTDNRDSKNCSCISNVDNSGVVVKSCGVITDGESVKRLPVCDDVELSVIAAETATTQPVETNVDDDLIPVTEVKSNVKDVPITEENYPKLPQVCSNEDTKNQSVGCMEVIKNDTVTYSDLERVQSMSANALYEELHVKYQNIIVAHEKNELQWKNEKAELLARIEGLKNQLQQQTTMNNVSQVNNGRRRKSNEESDEKIIMHDDVKARNKRLTFAEVIQNVAASPELTRRIKCSEVNSNELNDVLGDSTKSKEFGIVAHKKRIDNVLTLHFENPDLANKFVTEFNELVTVHAKCVNEIKRLKEHSDGLAKQMKYAPMPGDHANKIDRPTYAEALKNATNGIARRIEVDERNEEFMQKITTANVKEIPGLTKIIPRGNKVATLVFENEAAVTEFETQSVVKFPKVFKINKTREYTPHMKIVCIDDIDTDCNELIAAAKNGNFLDDSVQLVREYTIRTPRRIYRNFIVSCTVDLLKEYLSNGVIIGNERRRCYESVRTLQCFRCYDYGHFSSNCKNNVVCRKCGENHVSTACTDLSGKFTCLNCKLAGKDYTHSITSENCPRRIERVNGLIDFLVKKKKL